MSANEYQFRKSKIISVAGRNLLIVMVAFFLSGCQFRSYYYIDFLQNKNINVLEKRKPIVSGIFGVGEIPTHLALGENSQKLNFHVDENGYIANVKITSSSNGIFNKIHLDDSGDIQNRCFSYKDEGRQISIVIVNSSACSGHMKINSLDDAGNIIFSRNIDYVIRSAGVVAIVDGI